MNERFNQLLKQVEEETNAEYQDESRRKRRLYNEILLPKFAELIVRECIDKITTYDLVPGHSAKWEDIYDIHARLLQDLGEELKEHFGVEE